MPPPTQSTVPMLVLAAAIAAAATFGLLHYLHLSRELEAYIGIGGVCIVAAINGIRLAYESYYIRHGSYMASMLVTQAATAAFILALIYLVN